LSHGDTSDKPKFIVEKNKLKGIYQVGKGLIFPMEYSHLSSIYAYKHTFIKAANKKDEYALFSLEGKKITDFGYSFKYDYKKKKLIGTKGAEKIVVLENGELVPLK
jgi:hypothetical protein